MQKLKPNKTKRPKSENTAVNTFIKVQIFALICYLIIFLLGCLIALSIDLPHSFDFVFSLVTFTVSSFAVGFYAGLKIRQNGLLVGIIYALPINTLIIIISLAVSDFTVSINILITALCLILASAVGGIVAVNKRLRK